MNKKRQKFAKLDIKMVYSESFQDLTLAARKILDYLLLQLEWVNTQPANRKPRWELQNRDKISLLYSTFTKSPFKMHKQSITRGIDSLLAHGFLEIVSQGGAYRGQNSIYRYSDGWESWKQGEILSVRKPFFARGFIKK